MRSVDLGSLFSFKIILPACWLKIELRKEKILAERLTGVESGG